MNDKSNKQNETYQLNLRCMKRFETIMTRLLDILENTQWKVQEVQEEVLGQEVQVPEALYHKDKKHSKLHCRYLLNRASLVAQMVKNQPQSLDEDDPLEKVIATHCSILAWRIPRTGRLMGLQRVSNTFTY